MCGGMFSSAHTGVTVALSSPVPSLLLLLLLQQSLHTLVLQLQFFNGAAATSSASAALTAAVEEEMETRYGVAGALGMVKLMSLAALL